MASIFTWSSQKPALTWTATRDNQVTALAHTGRERLVAVAATSLQQVEALVIENGQGKQLVRVGPF
ncbi:hypothetical protein OG568_60700 (plasmid) [Streptomyces sp. NBC_01450]|uniref:hypothetical protein n=1 Tax=Streptomyces sp. NBC_01450 TaxID=2903871 RepID=UPI002E31A599|nr:hypothetical protein [Streptomyces sp. NBC_01450]